MKAPRRVAANRANARHSTGPKTASGKRRSALNAVRHGLSVPVACDAELDPSVTELALTIARQAKNEEQLILAHRIAEAQIDLLRIQRASRRAGLEPDASADAIVAALTHDAALDRYERRARSRRMAAIRSFEMLQLTWDGSARDALNSGESNA